jgi:anti-sigma B factor antagonist
MSVSCSDRSAPRRSRRASDPPPVCSCATVRATVLVRGELDIDTAPLLAAAIDGAIARRPAVPLVLDLAGVTFLSAAGVAALVRARTAVAAAGRTLSLRDPSAPAWLVLARTGDLDHFAVEPAPEPA